RARGTRPRRAPLSLPVRAARRARLRRLGGLRIPAARRHERGIGMVAPLARDRRLNRPRFGRMAALGLLAVRPYSLRRLALPCTRGEAGPRSGRMAALGLLAVRPYCLRRPALPCTRSEAGPRSGRVAALGHPYP